MHTITSIHKQKEERQKIVAVALYDASFAAMAVAAGIEVLLVGDSLGMVVQGYSNTLPVRLRDMCYHTSSVARANSSSFLVADMPFASYGSEEQALQSAARLMRSGAHMVKLEGGLRLVDIVRTLCNNGIPVCAHLGLTPQSVHTFGGYKVQGKTSQQADQIVQEAIELERAGASLLVLECVPSELARVITSELTIPTIGIGAGVDTDGQVLVVYDILGIGTTRKPRFVKNFLTGCDSIGQALEKYANDVRDIRFPAPEHTYSY